MDKSDNILEIKPKTPKKRFQTVSFEQREEILQKRNKENTNKATKQWTNCFNDYLKECGHPDLDALTPEQLPSILENFYSAVCKKPKESDENPQQDEEMPQQGNLQCHDKKFCYKNTTMKAIRGALNRYFKDKFSLDIISNEAFTRANSLFSGVLQINKEHGLGDIDSKTDISDGDMEILRMRFTNSINGPPNPKLLQEIVIFYILYYMCR